MSFIFLSNTILVYLFIVLLPNNGPTSHVAASLSSSSKVMPIKSPSQFQSTLSQSTFTFVKFFDPECLHCQEMAPVFESLCTRLYKPADSKTHVTCVEVDVTLDRNSPITDQFHVVSIPTLYFIHRNPKTNQTSTELHGGARTVSAMYDFVMNAVKVASSPSLSHFTTKEQVESFLTLIGRHGTPVLFFYPDEFRDDSSNNQRPPIISEWKSIVDSFRSEASVKFATVSSRDLLYPEACIDQFKRTSLIYAHGPVAFVATSATSSSSTICQRAKWYFSFIKDVESLSSFVHTNIITADLFITLTKLNARHMLLSSHPFFFVFGKSQSPSPAADYMLSELAGVARSDNAIIPVYVSTALFPHILSYVRENENENRTLTDLEVDKNNNYDENPIVYYFKDINQGVKVNQLSLLRGNNEGHESLQGWAKSHLKEIRKSLQVSTYAGRVNELSSAKWYTLFEHDKRNMLLLLFHADDDEGTSKEALATFSKIAKIIEDCSEHVFVASFKVTGTNPNVQGHQGDAGVNLPSWSELHHVKLPAIVMLQPGLKPDVYHGLWTAGAIARFARSFVTIGEENSDENIGLSSQDIVLVRSFALGLLMTAFGFVGLLSLLIFRKRTVITNILSKRGLGFGTTREGDEGILLQHVKSK